MRRPPLPATQTLPSILAALAAMSLTAAADWRSDVGWTAFKAQLGPGYPDGSGVLVIQSEFDESADPGLQFKPDATNSEMTGKTITPLSTGSNSAHALAVAKRFYGNTLGIAHGVGKVENGEEIHAYYAIDYLNAFAGLAADRKVHCNAWTADYPSGAAASLGSIDSTINSKGFLVVGGLNNSAGSAISHLFATNYNSLCVGRSDGKHSRNGTTLADYGPGRTKPEIVIPQNATSFSIGGVSSVAAVLYEVATTAGHTDATDNSEVIKAIMMAGATKQEFTGWDRTTLRPIDEVFGAGEANIFNSYHILAAGQHGPGTVAHTGWNHNSISDPPGPSNFTARSYDFSIPATHWANDFSVVLNWNYIGTAAVRDLKLELFSLTGGPTLLDESNSAVDNVEHIYQRNLPAGDYRLTVSRVDTDDDAIDYGLAWHSQIGDGPFTITGESINAKPEVTVTNIFKDRLYTIERSYGLDSWTTVHTVTPATWANIVWEDPDGFPVGGKVFYRSGFTR